MSVRDPLMEGNGDFHSFVEETETETGFSVAHLDSFLSRVYNYYLGKGFVCILLRNSLSLVTFAFTILLATFLVSFVNYKHLSTPPYNWGESVDINIRNVHPVTGICFVVFSIFWLWQLLQVLKQAKHNLEIKHFYSKQLSISELELQTIEWREVVQRISTVKRLCRVKDYLSALDISARIMRKENYLIALINKDILNLRIPLPFLRDSNIFTKTTEWSIQICLFNVIFDEHHTIHPDYLDPMKRERMAKSLQSKFRFNALMALFLSPFIFLYLLVYFFFKYGEEIRNTPGSVLSAREWTPLARWKFREFNELPHYLHNRLSYSNKSANEYLDQFPMNAVTIIAKFIEFIAGAGLAVLLLIGLWEEEILLNSEIFEKSPLWYAGILGTIVAVCRGAIPDRHAVFDPQKSMDEVSSFTHYYPNHWNNNAYTEKVRKEFSSLFQFRVVQFFSEMMGVVCAPFLLAFSLPSCSLQVVDFFRDFTVEVPGVGYVCSCSSFAHAEKHASEKFGVTSNAEKKMQTKHGKLEKSMITFKANNPTWNVGPQGEELFGNLSEFIHQNEKNNYTNNNYINNNNNNGSYPLSSPSISPPSIFAPQNTVKNFLQDSLVTSPNILSQSISILRPRPNNNNNNNNNINMSNDSNNNTVTFADSYSSTVNNLDPKALAFLHKVHQKFHETKAKRNSFIPPSVPLSSSSSAPPPSSSSVYEDSDIF